MKKALFSLLVVLVLLVPFVAFAFSQKGTIDNEASGGVQEIEGNKIQQYHNVWVINEGASDSDDISVKTAVFTIINVGPAVESVECGGIEGKFTAETSKNSNGQTVCTFTSINAEGEKAEKVNVGQIVVTADATANDEDCTIEYSFGGTSGSKENPKTGNNLPYVIIGSGIALAVGAYVVTNRRTRLYKI